jgi:hypothetical protein
LLVSFTTGEIVGAAVVESEVNVNEVTAERPLMPATGVRLVEAVMLFRFEIPSNVRAAEAGTVDKTPIPKAATATSAMRLIVVFVDICFLSISRVREFPVLGLNQISLIRFDESHVLIHQIPHRVSGRGEETYLFICHLHRLR